MDILEHLQSQESFSQFAHEHFGKKIIHGKSQFTQNIIDENQILDAISNSLFPLSKVSVENRVNITHHKGKTHIPGKQLKEYFQAGDFSVILRNLLSYLNCDPLHQFRAQLQTVSRSIVRSNMYLTLKGLGGYPFHWDTHNLVVFQLAGKKHWNLFEPIVENPTPYMNKENYQPSSPAPFKLALQTELEVGDFLFVPKGFGHKVKTTDDSSLHITFGFHDSSFYDLFKISADNTINDLKLNPDFRNFFINSKVDNENILKGFMDVFKENLQENIDFLTNRNYQEISTSYTTGAFTEDMDYEIQLKNPNCFLSHDKTYNQYVIKLGNPTQMGNITINVPEDQLATVKKIFKQGKLTPQEVKACQINTKLLKDMEYFELIKISKRSL